MAKPLKTERVRRHFEQREQAWELRSAGRYGPDDIGDSASVPAELPGGGASPSGLEPEAVPASGQGSGGTPAGGEEVLDLTDEVEAPADGVSGEAVDSPQGVAGEPAAGEADGPDRGLPAAADDLPDSTDGDPTDTDTAGSSPSDEQPDGEGAADGNVVGSGVAADVAGDQTGPDGTGPGDEHPGEPAPAPTTSERTSAPRARTKKTGAAGGTKAEAPAPVGSLDAYRQRKGKLLSYRVPYDAHRVAKAIKPTLAAEFEGREPELGVIFERALAAFPDDTARMHQLLDYYLPYIDGAARDGDQATLGGRVEEWARTRLGRIQTRLGRERIKLNLEQIFSVALVDWLITQGTRPEVANSDLAEDLEAMQVAASEAAERYRTRTG